MLKNNKKIGRNEKCPCGSGLKYKKCCIFKNNNGESKDILRQKRYLQKHNILLKKKIDVEGIKKSGKLVLEILDKVEKMIEPGIKTNDIDHFAHEFIIQKGAIPAPLNYKGFPKSICISINDVICHGIPGEYILKDGDIANIDVTTILNGYFADANKTFFVGTPNDDAKKIVETAKKCLKEGMDMVAPGNTVGDIGWAIQQYAEKRRCSVVREFVGHGVGFKFHESPQVPHYGVRKQGIKLFPGMVFTIEPMINLGTEKLYVLDDNWTAKTQDGRLSAQFEQTLLVTDYGYESLTPFEL